MKLTLVLWIWILLAAAPTSLALDMSGVFGSSGWDYYVSTWSNGRFGWPTVEISPCSGDGYGFVLHKLYSDWCEAKIFRFDKRGEDYMVEVISDASGGGYGDCYGDFGFSIAFEDVNGDCDIAFVVKIRVTDSSTHWIQKHYIASSPYDADSFRHLEQLDKIWDEDSNWGFSHLEYRGLVVCGSSNFYYVHLSDDADEFCLTNGMDLEDAECFPNDPPLQAGCCYSESGDDFYIGLFYNYVSCGDYSGETIHIRKFSLNGTSSSCVAEDSSTLLAGYVYMSDVIVVENGWEPEIFVAISYRAYDYLHLMRLDTDLDPISSRDIYDSNYWYPLVRLHYRQDDGFLYVNYRWGEYVRQLSLFTLDAAYNHYMGWCCHGEILISQDAENEKVCGAFGGYNYAFGHSFLYVTHPTISGSLPDLHFYINKPEEFVLQTDYFSGVAAGSDFDPFYLRPPSDEFSFVKFDPIQKKFTGTAPASLFIDNTHFDIVKSERFYIRAYSYDEVFIETSFLVYAHAYIVYTGIPIPTVSYENGKVVNTTINLLDYFVIADPPGFKIRVVEFEGLPDGVTLTVDFDSVTLRFNGTVPGEVENCRNPYPIEVILSDEYSEHSAQFVFETTKFRPMINFDIVNETTLYLPSQSVPIGTGININVDHSFVEMSVGVRTISYIAQLRDGSPLPSWLMFDPDSRMFSGFAPNTGCYDLDIEIIGLNDCGLDRSVYLKFSVTNEPPEFDETLSNITNQVANAGDKGFFVFDASCFINEDYLVEGPLIFDYRTKVNGMEVMNPEWLSMTYSWPNKTIRFDYDVPSVCVNYSIDIVAWDTCSSNPVVASTPFSFVITNEGPRVGGSIKDFVVNGGEYFNISIPPDTFQDPEGFDLAYQALRINDESGNVGPLPFYVTFDSDTLSFSGECDTGDNDTIHVLLEATDGCSIVSTDFKIFVVYLPTPGPTPPPESASYTGEVITIIGGSLAVSLAIGLGAFGFKVHRKEMNQKVTANLFREQEENENIAKEIAERKREKNIQIELNDLNSIESRTISESESSIGEEDTVSLTVSDETFSP